MNPLGGLIDWITAPLQSLASWAGDKIFEGITNWIAKGVVQLLGFVWSVMDRSSSPHLNAEWYSGTATSPYGVAARIGGVVLLGMFLMSIMHGIVNGDVTGILRRVATDLPLTVFAMVGLVGLTQAALGLTDAMSDTIWAGTRANAVKVFDGLGQISSKVSGGSFLAPLVMIVLMIALLFLWLALFIRESLIYLVVVLAVAFALPGMVWPSLRSMTRHTIELLVSLIIAKPVIALALSVGVGALGGVGATGSPGDGVAENGLAEFGTLIVGIICFGLAAFMPYLVYKLLPVVAAATVAAGVASGPLRAAATGMQFQYYAQSTMHRLAGSAGQQQAASGAPPMVTAGGAASGASGTASGQAAAASTPAAATSVAGPAGVVAGAGVTAAGAAIRAVQTTTDDIGVQPTQTADESARDDV
jgi:hypothetical protein